MIIIGFGQYREFYDMNKLQDIYPKRLKTAHLTVHFINETRNFLTNGRVGPNDLGDPLVLKRNGQLELIGILKGTDSESGITYPHFLNVWAHKTWITKVIERSQYVIFNSYININEFLGARICDKYRTYVIVAF
jgi:hypothetical protein